MHPPPSSPIAAPPTDAAPALSSPWGTVPLPDGRTVHRRVGPLELWLLRTEGEVRLASAPVPIGGIGGGAPPPEDLHETEETPPDTAAWTRWATPEPVTEVRLSPALPDRAVVMEPEVPFVLLPGAEARVYVRVPLMVRVQVAGPDGDLALREIPTLVLSDTWWGDFLEGELSYWIHTTARRRIGPEHLTPYLAICPLHLVNRSGAELKVEKLTLRVAHLTLFALDGGAGGLWTDTSRVRYLGDAEGSQIDMSGQPPQEAKGAEKITDPRQPPQRGLRARTFARLRALPGVGGGW